MKFVFFISCLGSGNRSTKNILSSSGRAYLDLCSRVKIRNFERNLVENSCKSEYRLPWKFNIDCIIIVIPWPFRNSLNLEFKRFFFNILKTMFQDWTDTKIKHFKIQSYVTGFYFIYFSWEFCISISHFKFCI